MKLYNLKHFSFLFKREKGVYIENTINKFSIFIAKGGENGTMARNNVGGGE